MYFLEAIVRRQILEKSCKYISYIACVPYRNIFSEGNLAIGIDLYVSYLVSSKFLGFSLGETPVSGSGSGDPNQRLRVFVLF